MNPSIPPARTQPLLNQPATYQDLQQSMQIHTIPTSNVEHLPLLTVDSLATNFNIGTCTREHGRYLHICNFCGGAHDRPVCPVFKAVNKKNKFLKMTFRLCCPALNTVLKLWWNACSPKTPSVIISNLLLHSLTL